MVQQSSIKRALTSSKQDKWPKRSSDPLCPLTASTWAREHECADPGIFVRGGGEGGMQVYLTQTSLTILFRGDKGGGGGG